MTGKGEIEVDANEDEIPTQLIANNKKSLDETTLQVIFNSNAIKLKSF